LPHLQTALSISLPDKGQPRRPERKQSWPRVQSWTTGDFSQVPSVSTNLEEHPPPELSGRMETPCEPGPVGRHQARLPAELWRCGQSNQTSALVISLYSNEFKFTCKTGYSYWFEHIPRYTHRNTQIHAEIHTDAHRYTPRYTHPQIYTLKYTGSHV